MKSKFFIIAMIAAGSLVTGAAKAQVHVQVGINEGVYPGYTYYSYPAWHGHYRDHVYYEHYHDRFYREHRSYFVGKRFDHDRYERDRNRHHDH
ncbi:MAG TPA: hypothetical protein VNU70_02975 [Puia sp.]|nr:hypothetical protein [Puia sp.]